jgi:hypothetical protein
MDGLIMLSTLNVYRRTHAHNLEIGERVAIWWMDGDSRDDSTDSWALDYATVVDVSEYQATVRVGWIADSPMLMTFARRTREFVAESIPQYSAAIPVIRESRGIPTNYAQGL